jgi:hypothetical protein
MVISLVLPLDMSNFPYPVQVKNFKKGGDTFEAMYLFVAGQECHQNFLCTQITDFYGTITCAKDHSIGI